MPLPGFLQFLSGRVVGETFSYGIGGAISPALAPLSQEVANDIWPEHAVVPNTPEELAAMAVQGVMSEQDAAHEALMSGVNNERFHRLFRVNGDPVAPQEALTLWNRGVINEDDVNRALLQSRLKPEWVDEFKHLRHQVISAADAAEMVVQGIIGQPEGESFATEDGWDSESFDRFVRLAGNPPGPQDTLSLWNRGLMTEQEATLALRQSRLKPEWIETVKQSRIHPVSTAQAVEAVVKQQITRDEGVSIAAENGIDAKGFDLLVKAAGRPIGIVQALALYNRGYFTRADVEEVVARSNVRTDYTDAVLHLAIRYPSLFQIRTLIQNGAIDDAYAISLITDQGYPQKLAEGIVKAAHGEKLQTHKDLTVSEITTLYQGEAISREDAVAMLGDLDYDAKESAFILDLAEFRRIARFQEAVINRLHSQYVAHRIAEDVVSNTLDKLGVAQAQRENLIDLWKEERGANVKVLTPAQIVKATHKGLLTADDGKAELMYQGYSDRDAGILLQL
jgi:hypothetical protein